MSTASIDGIVSPAAIADDDLMTLEFDGFHPAKKKRPLSIGPAVFA